MLKDHKGGQRSSHCHDEELAGGKFSFKFQ